MTGVPVIIAPAPMTAPRCTTALESIVNQALTDEAEVATAPHRSTCTTTFSSRKAITCADHPRAAQPSSPSAAGGHRRRSRSSPSISSPRGSTLAARSSPDCVKQIITTWPAFRSSARRASTRRTGECLEDFLADGQHLAPPRDRRLVLSDHVDKRARSPRWQKAVKRSGNLDRR